MNSESKRLNDIRDEWEFGAPVRGLSEFSRKALRSYQRRLIGFIDILGFGELVARMSTDPALQGRVLNALRGLANLRSERLSDGDFMVDRRCSFFSDTVVISYPFYLQEEVEWLLMDLSVLTRQLVEEGMSVRGAVVLSDLYHTPGIIVGPALLEAYDLEKTQAIFPRIIISKQVMRAGLGVADGTSEEELAQWIKAGQQDAQLEGREYSEFPKLLLQDEDGYYFLDHLHVNECNSQIGPEYVNKHLEYLGKVRQLIVDNLIVIRQLEGRVRVAELRRRKVKWRWYAQYFNRACSVFTTHGNVKPLTPFTLNRLWKT